MKKSILLALSSMFLLSAPLIYEFIIVEETAASASATATVSVDPSISKAEVGQTFTVNIEISNVVDLYGWEFKLGWNSTLLDVINVIEGPFLKDGGDTFFTFKINNTEGNVLVDCTLLGDVPGVSGNGTLATVEFYVQKVGESILDLYDAILVSSLGEPITHTAIDGYYYTPIHDTAIIDLAASETVVHVTAENQGTETETFDVSAYYTRLVDPLIGTQTTTLTSGANTTLTFTWTPPSSGRYEIRAEAETVLGETDIADNTRTIIIAVGYGGGTLHNESVNGSHTVAFTVAFTFALFGAFVMPIASYWNLTLGFRKRRFQVDIPTSISRHNMHTSARQNVWHDLAWRKII